MRYQALIAHSLRLCPASSTRLAAPVGGHGIPWERGPDRWNHRLGTSGRRNAAGTAVILISVRGRWEPPTHSGQCRKVRYTRIAQTLAPRTRGQAQGDGLAGSACPWREGLRHAIGHAKGACSKNSSGCSSIYRSSPIVLADPLAKGFVDASLPPASSQLEIVDYVRRKADRGRHFRPSNGRSTAPNRSLGELLRPTVSGQIRRVVPAQALAGRVLVLVHLLSSRR